MRVLRAGSPYRLRIRTSGYPLRDRCAVRPSRYARQLDAPRLPSDTCDFTALREYMSGVAEAVGEDAVVRLAIGAQEVGV